MTKQELLERKDQAHFICGLMIYLREKYNLNENELRTEEVWIKKEKEPGASGYGYEMIRRYELQHIITMKTEKHNQIRFDAIKESENLQIEWLNLGY